MLAQAYSDGLLRIFDNDGKKICDMDFTPSLRAEADKQLRRLKLRRREPWRYINDFYEAKLRFDR